MQKRVIFSMTCGSLRTTGGATAALTLACLLAAPAQADPQLWSKTVSLTAAEVARFAPPPRDTANFEARMVDEVMAAANQARARQGLGPLSRDAALDAVAAGYSRKMMAEGFFDHVSPDGSTLKSRLGGHMQRLGRAAENLWTARGKIDWSPASVSQQTVENWLDSPGHRRNLLERDFVAAGVGVSQRGDAIYVTMLYGAAGGGAAGETLMAAAPQQAQPVVAPAGFGSSMEASALSAINAVRARNGLAALQVDQRLAGFARDRSREMGRAGRMDADGGLLGRASAATGARRVAATVWKGDNVAWSAENLAQTMLDTWAREPSNMQALLDGSYASVGLGVEVVDGGVRLAAIFTDGAGGFVGAPARTGQPATSFASAAPVHAPIQLAQAPVAPVYDLAFNGFSDLQTGSIGGLSLPTHQVASLPVYEPGDAGVRGSRGFVAAPVYDPAPVRVAAAPVYDPAPVQIAQAPRTSPTPRPAPFYEPVQIAQASPSVTTTTTTTTRVVTPVYDGSAVQIAVERRLEAPVSERRGWVTRRVTTVVASGDAGGGLIGFFN